MSDDTRPPPTRHSTDLAVEAIADLASKSIAACPTSTDLDGAMRGAAAMLLAQAYDDINLLADENKRLADRIDHLLGGLTWSEATAANPMPGDDS